jgi:hypothetical protein
VPGETKEIAFTITPAMLSMLNEQMQTVVEPGNFRIMIGASSRDIRLKISFICFMHTVLPMEILKCVILDLAIDTRVKV